VRSREIEQLNARYQQRAGEARQAFKQLSAQPGLARPLELFTQLQARDSLVVALLQNYRQGLVQKMGAQARDVRFQAHVDDPYTLTKGISANEFLRNPVGLKYLEEA
jgi:D-mannonate dehydratase